jgi:hypothetical protein
MASWSVAARITAATSIAMAQDVTDDDLATSTVTLRRTRRRAMTWVEWMLGTILIVFYIVCLFTVCSLTFQKGRTLLGIAGIFMPLLWLIGAILPAKRGSRFDVAQQTAYQQRMQQQTS